MDLNISSENFEEQVMLKETNTRKFLHIMKAFGGVCNCRFEPNSKSLSSFSQTNRLLLSTSTFQTLPRRLLYFSQLRFDDKTISTVAIRHNSTISLETSSISLSRPRGRGGKKIGERPLERCQFKGFFKYSTQLELRKRDRVYSVKKTLLTPHIH